MQPWLRPFSSCFGMQRRADTASRPYLFRDSGSIDVHDVVLRQRSLVLLFQLAFDIASYPTHLT